jgi:hypothetical protein
MKFLLSALLVMNFQSVMAQNQHGGGSSGGSGSYTQEQVEDTFPATDDTHSKGVQTIKVFPNDSSFEALQKPFEKAIGEEALEYKKDETLKNYVQPIPSQLNEINQQGYEPCPDHDAQHLDEGKITP